MGAIISRHLHGGALLLLRLDNRSTPPCCYRRRTPLTPGFHDVFGLYGRPERYNWDPKNPKSLFFAYPQGQDRGVSWKGTRTPAEDLWQRLFLDIDEALRADFRLTSLPAVRAQFIALLVQRLSAPASAEQYRGTSGDAEDDSSAPPRPEGNYRLPPLSFGDPSPSVSHDSQPRSLTPITERTDIIDGTSRTPSTRTAGSNFFMGNPPTREGSKDREYSSSKQGSGGSSRHTAQGSGDSKIDRDRLAPISDSTETFGPYTDEPEPRGAKGDGPTPTDTLESVNTDRSAWSRSTGHTPTQTPGVADKIQPVFPLPPTDSDSTIGPSRDVKEEDLPDLPAQTQQQQQQQQQQLEQTEEQAPQRQRSTASTSDEARQHAFDTLTARSPAAAQSPQAIPSAQTHSPSSSAGRAAPALAAAVTSPTSPPKAVQPTAAATASSTTTTPATATATTTAPAPAPASASAQPVAQPTPRRGSVDPSTAMLQDEPAAMYLMNMVDEPAPESASTAAPPASSRLVASASAAPISPSPERPRIITQFDKPSSVSSSNHSQGHNQPLGRKPSGGRAPPPPKKSSSGSRRMEAISDEQPGGSGSGSGEGGSQGSSGEAQKTRLPSSATNADLAEDAAQYMAFAEQPSPEKKPVPVPPASKVDDKGKAEEEQMRSSFAPSRAAAERRAKAEMAEVEQKRAMNVPGGGKRAGPRQAGLWSDSEEDEDEEERDADADSPVAVRRGQTGNGQAGPSHGGQGQGQGPAQHPQRMASQTRALPPVPRSNGTGEASGSGPGPSAERRDSAYERDIYAQQQQQQRGYSTHSTFSAVSDRPRADSPAAPHRNLPPHPSRQANQTPPAAPPAARQTMWNANFSAEHGMDAPKSGKFVDLEDGPAQLTKAFAPHGLLQAGMQDKEDRSAKRQEETARELGSSLINVPSKPPPPSAGLLGAVAQHEKARSGAGGIGAALTDREREKRLAVSSVECGVVWSFLFGDGRWEWTIMFGYFRGVHRRRMGELCRGGALRVGEWHSSVIPTELRVICRLAAPATRRLQIISLTGRKSASVKLKSCRDSRWSI